MASIEERVSKLETKMENLYRDFYGNGQPGLLDEFRELKSDWRRREKDKMTYDDRQERRSQKTLTLAGIAVGILTLIAIAIGSWAAVRALNHESLLRLEGGGVPVENADWRIR